MIHRSTPRNAIFPTPPDSPTVPQIQHVWKTPCPTAPGDGLQQRNSHRPGRPTYPDCIGGWLSQQARRSISYPRWNRTQSGQEFKYCVQPDQNKGSRFADNDNSFFMKKTKELYPIFLIIHLGFLMIMKLTKNWKSTKTVFLLTIVKLSFY